MPLASASPRAVTFDCWGTLVYDADLEGAFAARARAAWRVASRAGVRADPDAARRAFDAAWTRHWEAWQSGRATGASEIARWTLEALGLAPRELAPAAAELEQAFERAALEGSVRALDGARATLEALAAAGIRRALVCDTGLTPGRVVRELLARLDLLAPLEVLVFSDEVGFPKPHPRAFRRALAGLDVGSDAAVHVGDLRRTDVAGGRGVGMGTVRLRGHHDDRSAHPEADAVADDHRGVRRVLGVR